MTTIEAVKGDITTQQVDAIVNAANWTLLGGGGVDGRIHDVAGPRLLAACQELRRTTHPDGLAVGDVVATEAGDLPCRWVIHTVGPNRHAGETDPALLRSCFTGSIRLAAELGASSLAIPAVSAGIFGWGMEDVARIAVEAAGASAPATSLELIRFVLFDDGAFAPFEAALSRPRRASATRRSAS